MQEITAVIKLIIQSTELREIKQHIIPWHELKHADMIKLLSILRIDHPPHMGHLLCNQEYQ